MSVAGTFCEGCWVEVTGEALELLDAVLHGLSGEGGGVGGGGDVLELLVVLVHGLGGEEWVSRTFCKSCWVEVISEALELLDAVLHGLCGEGG